MILPKQIFREFWNENYGNLSPVGWNLKRDLENLHARFHALPKSKRYPDNESERQIIIERAHILFNEIIPKNNSFWLISNRPKSQVGIIDFGSEDRFTIENYNLQKNYEWVDLEESIEDQIPWETFTRYYDELNDNYNDIFLKIADEEDWGTLFINNQSKDILAPYDGGFDLIINDNQKRSALINRYASWLP